MKNTMKRVAAVLLSACVLCVCLPAMALAAAPATYQVTFSAGADGLLPGGERTVTYTVAANATCVAPQVTSSDDLHSATYYTSADLAGHGAADGTVYPGGAVTVQRDVTYVVQYAASVNTAAYSVQYLDENGLEIAPSVVGHAAQGTTLTLNAPTVSGYTLNDSASKQAVVSDAGTAVSFRYTTNPTTQEVITTNTVTQYQDQVVYTEVPAAGAGAGAGAGTATVPDEEVPQGPTPESESGSESAASAAGNEASDSTASIEDESVPQGAGVDSNTGMSTSTVVGIGAAALVIGALILFLVKRKGNQV